MKNQILVAVALTILIGSLHVQSEDLNEAPYQLSASLIQLITDPQRADGIRLRTAGYLSVVVNLHLYLSKEYADLNDINSAIVVEGRGVEALKSNGCLDRYVWLVGEFSRLTGGEYGIRRLDEIWVMGGPLGETLCWKRE